MPERIPFDSAAYVKRIQTDPCFICELVSGKRAGNDLVYQTQNAIAFLNKYPTLYGYTLVAPRAHREHVTGDFTLDQYLALQRFVYHVAEAVRIETSAERVYVLSLGSQQGNRHVHWHIAPLPPGVPFEEQQLAALNLSKGYIQLDDAERASLAARLRERIEKIRHGVIRPIAIALIRRGDAILVFQGNDPKTNRAFFRPLGGGIEFGERGEDAIVREMREEIGAEIVNVRYRATLENIFTFDGQTGHEIVFLFEAELADASLYARERLPMNENGDTSLCATWKSLDQFAHGDARLVPEGLTELLLGDQR